MSEKSKLVPVVGLAELKEWCEKQKRLLAKHKAVDAFHEGELSGSIEQLEIMLSWAERRSKGETK